VRTSRGDIAGSDLGVDEFPAARVLVSKPIQRLPLFGVSDGWSLFTLPTSVPADDTVFIVASSPLHEQQPILLPIGFKIISNKFNRPPVDFCDSLSPRRLSCAFSEISIIKSIPAMIRKRYSCYDSEKLKSST
jgi:hypothetical protein